MLASERAGRRDRVSGPYAARQNVIPYLREDLRLKGGFMISAQLEGKEHRARLMHDESDGPSFEP
jgi:hypothetical protein